MIRTVEGREGLPCQWQQVDWLLQPRKRIVKWRFNIRNKPSGIEKLWLFSDSSCKRSRWHQGARFKSNKKHWLLMSCTGKVKISIPLDFINTESFVWVQGERGWVQGSVTTPWLVGTSVPPQASSIGWKCAEIVDASLHMDLHLFMLRIKFCYFLHLSLWKESMQLSVTYLDSALICASTLLFARERQK